MITALRFIDEFRPGDSIPADRYAPDHLAQMAERGRIQIKAQPVAQEPPAPKQAGRRKRTAGE